MRITLRGTVPAQKNRKVIMTNRSTGRPFLGTLARVKQWQEDVAWQLKIFRAWDKPYPVKMICTFYFADLRRRDLSNCLDSIQDALVNAGIIKDDDYKHLGKVTIKYGGLDKVNPRAEIIIKELHE